MHEDVVGRPLRRPYRARRQSAPLRFMGSSPVRTAGLASRSGNGGDQLHEWMSGIADFRYRHDRCSCSRTAPRRGHQGGGTTYTFVSEGIETALEQARAVAGRQGRPDRRRAKHRSAVPQSGLLDELEIHIVPILMGGGVRLFEGTQQLALDPTGTVESPDVTHVRYRVPK